MKPSIRLNSNFNDLLEVSAMGESTVLIRLATKQKSTILDMQNNLFIHALAEKIRRQLFGRFQLRDIVPAYTSLALFFPEAKHITSDFFVALSQLLSDEIEKHLPFERASPYESQAEILNVPVCYGASAHPDCGIDLTSVATHCKMSTEAVIALHCAPIYHIAMLGFQPGFPYLLGLDPKLAISRRAEPRTQVAAGSVAIGGNQAGIYPQASPGGWYLLGRTALTLFDPMSSSPCLLRPGQKLRFIAVDSLDHVIESHGCAQ